LHRGSVGLVFGDLAERAFGFELRVLGAFFEQFDGDQPAQRSEARVAEECY